MKGASASFSFPRRGSRGFNGRRRRTWLTPAARGETAKRSAAATARSVRTRGEDRIGRAVIERTFTELGPTGGFPGGARVGRVELGEARVVAADVVVVGAQLQRLLVLLQRPRELAGRLERHGEVVVGPRVVGLLGDRLLEAELRFPPQALLGDLGAERDLGVGLLGVGVGGAGGGQDHQTRDGRHSPTHAHTLLPRLLGDRYYRKALPSRKISCFRRAMKKSLKGGR